MDIRLQMHVMRNLIPFMTTHAEQSNNYVQIPMLSKILW